MKLTCPHGLLISLAILFVICYANGSESKTGNSDDLLNDDGYTGDIKHAEMLFRLSINQSEEGLEKLLVKIDKNNDQIISQDELIAWILKSNDGIEEKEAKIYINQFDQNHDNGVSWNEYFEHYYGSPTYEFAKSNSDHQEILAFVEQDKFRFQSADSNKDEILELKELKAFLHPHNHEEMLDYEVEKMMADYDLDNDTKISKNEFMHIQYGGTKANPLQQTRINRVFENHDSDHDDMLSFEEAKMWLKPDVNEFSKTEAIHLMKVSDVNNDQKVTKEEILENLEHWMKSKATNFGEHVRDEL